MRCLCCNARLSNAEATRKDANGFVDMCNTCYSPSSADFNEEEDVSPVLEDNRDDEIDLGDINFDDLDYKDDQ